MRSNPPAPRHSHWPFPGYSGAWASLGTPIPHWGSLPQDSFPVLPPISVPHRARALSLSLSLGLLEASEDRWQGGPISHLGDVDIKTREGPQDTQWIRGRGGLTLASLYFSAYKFP